MINVLGGSTFGSIFPTTLRKVERCVRACLDTSGVHFGEWRWLIASLVQIRHAMINNYKLSFRGAWKLTLMSVFAPNESKKISAHARYYAAFFKMKFRHYNGYLWWFQKRRIFFFNEWDYPAVLGLACSQSVISLHNEKCYFSVIRLYNDNKLIMATIWDLTLLTNDVLHMSMYFLLQMLYLIHILSMET